MYRRNENINSYWNSEWPNFSWYKRIHVYITYASICLVHSSLASCTQTCLMSFADDHSTHPLTVLAQSTALVISSMALMARPDIITQTPEKYHHDITTASPPSCMVKHEKMQKGHATFVFTDNNHAQTRLINAADSYREVSHSVTQWSRQPGSISQHGDTVSALITPTLTTERGTQKLSKQ